MINPDVDPLLESPQLEPAQVRDEGSVVPDPDVTSPVATDDREVRRLQAELAALRAQLTTRRRRVSVLGTLRRMVAASLAFVAAFALVASVVGLWAAKTTLDTDRWVETVAPLPQNPQVAAAVADFTTTQVFQLVDVDQRLRAVLPPQAAFVVGPLTAQMRDYLSKTVRQVVQSDRFQPIWIAANRRAHQQTLAILEGRSSVVAARGDHVVIDLLPLVNQVLREISAQLPTLFGHTVTLPDISSGAIPANLRTVVERAVGVALPANFAQFTVYDGGRLTVLQHALVVVKRDLAILVIGMIASLVLALAVSPTRRRTVVQFGLWLAIAAVTVAATLRAVRAQLLIQVPAGTYRDGAAAAITTTTGILRERGTQLIWLGAVLALVAYLVGPGRVPVWLRRHLAIAGRFAGRGLRHGVRVGVTVGPSWLARHRDAVRVSGVAAAVLAALLLSSWTGLLVVVVVLAVFEAAVSLVGRQHGVTASAVGEPLP
jgi:hypothetical protein